MSELILKEDALNCFHDWIDRYGYEHTADEDTAYKRIAELPAVQPNRAIIDNCLYHIATGGAISIKRYMQALYEEIYGEGEKPWWMK